MERECSRLSLCSCDRDLLIERDRNMLSLAEALRLRDIDFCDHDLLSDCDTDCDCDCERDLL